MLEIIILSISLLCTIAVRQLAKKYRILDIPNQRSSHVTVTPRGGGIAIMIAFFAALLWNTYHHTVETPLFWALSAVLPIILISLADDIRQLPAKFRLLVQSVGALLAIIALGGISQIHLGFITLEGIWLNVPAFFFILWLTNLYNFLDGIDGYAGSEAVFVGIMGYWLFQNNMAEMLAVAALGFLVFNWHKASIFMGDVGSAPLGFIFAVFALNDASSEHFLGWVILLSLFWFDATVTLWRRHQNGEKLFTAHKKHMYQRLTQAGYGHHHVVLMGMGLNTVIAFMLWYSPSIYYGFVFLIVLILLWLVMKYIDRKKAFS